MSVEPKRRCGFRKIGGLYLVSDRGALPCDRLPIALERCPTCGHGIKQTRGWTWIDVAALVEGVHPACVDDFPCPLCLAPPDRAGLLWIGEQFYKTPFQFQTEADRLGVCRRITAIPRGFKIGETWICLAHPKAIEIPLRIEMLPANRIWDESIPPRWKAGIFKVWRPQRIEKILPESVRGSVEASELEQQGIVPVFVPDHDPDHRGTVYEDERAANVEPIC